jgi:DNA-binding NarL/FixJ family response regulator
VTVVQPVDAAATTDRKRVLVVDDHQIFADLLVSVLAKEADFECVGTAASTAAAVEVARRECPDLVVMDIRLGGDDGLDTIRCLHEVVPDAVVVVVSAHRGPLWVTRAVAAGASAFAAKCGTLDEVLSLLRRATRGSMLVSPSTFQEQPVPAAHNVPGMEPLSRREREILALIAEAKQPQEIAAQLHISVSTCRGYVQSIRGKLGVRTQLEAVIKAQRLGLIEFPAEG